MFSRDHRRQVPVGARHEPRVDLDGHRFAHRHHLALLQDAQQLGLEVQGDFRDFIEEQSPAVSRTDNTEHILFGAGERTADMAEELALEQRLADAGTINGDKKAITAAAVRTDATGDQFLARTAFPLNKNAAVGCRNLIHDPQDVADGVRHAHKDRCTVDRCTVRR